MYYFNGNPSLPVNKVAQGDKVIIPILAYSEIEIGYGSGYGQTPAGGFESGGSYRWTIRRTDDTQPLDPIIATDASPGGWGVEILNLGMLDNQPGLDPYHGVTGFTGFSGIPATLVVTPPPGVTCQEYYIDGVSIVYPGHIVLHSGGGYFTICFSWSSAPAVINVPSGGMAPIVGVTVSSPAGTSWRGRPLLGFGFNLLGNTQYLPGGGVPQVQVDIRTGWSATFPAILFSSTAAAYALAVPSRTFHVTNAASQGSGGSYLQERSYPLLDLGPFLVTFNYAPVIAPPPPPPPPAGGPALRYQEDAQHAPAWVTRTYSKDQQRAFYTTKDAGKTYQSESPPVTGNDLSLMISPQSGASIIIGSSSGKTNRAVKSGDSWAAPTNGSLLAAYSLIKQHPTDRQRMALISRNYSADDTVAGTVLRSAISYDGGSIFTNPVPIASLPAGDTPETQCAAEWAGDALIVCIPTQTPSTDFIVYKSVDGAQTWTQTVTHTLPALTPTYQFVGLSSVFHQGALYLSGFNYILGADGKPTGKVAHRLIRSGDLGATWDFVANLTPSDPYGLGVSSRTGRLLWGLTYYSLDAGATWQHV